MNVPVSEYLSDQGQRTHLLTCLESTYGFIYEIAGQLISLNHGGLTEAEISALYSHVCTMSMDLLSATHKLQPMLVDILLLDEG